MPTISNLGADGINPKSSAHQPMQNPERGHYGTLAIKVKYTDVLLAANTYILAKLPGGCAITRAEWLVTSAFNDGLDFGITKLDGTGGDADVLFDDSTIANHAAGFKNDGAGLHATSCFDGYLTTTDICYVSCDPTADTTSGEGTLFIEYLMPL
jgi:hypothetical protein